MLVERPLTQQHHELDSLEGARPTVEVVVHQPAPGESEALVEPPELVPERTRTEEAAALARRPEQPSTPGACRGADLEQPVTVGIPARPGQELVLGVLVVADLGRPHVRHRAQVECGRSDDRPGSEESRAPSF
jgi:hypothetical protein